MTIRRLLVPVAVVALSGCAALGPLVDQRTTQGPAAEDMWAYHVALRDGRTPTFDEKRHWGNTIDERISQYLREHPEAANSLDVSTFRFLRQVTVGMSKEQVLILIGAPLALTTDAGEMEKVARHFWPEIKGNATEAWAYPLGWRLYFAGQKLIDITRYLER